jgi:hypothetical protein
LSSASAKRISELAFISYDELIFISSLAGLGHSGSGLWCPVLRCGLD